MYFGSVRFFKNMILLAVIILIAVPTVLAARWGTALRIQRRETDLLTGELQRQTELYRQELDNMAELEAAMEVALTEEIHEEALAVAPMGAAPEYRELYPDFYAPQPLDAAGYEEGVIYLTFDDGPSDRTPEVLKILEEKNVRATFFVVGQTKEDNLQYMRDIVEAGHTIGMHTYSHRYKDIYASVEAYLADMYQIFTQIKETTGVVPTVFRFPGGSVNAYNHAVYQEIIAEMLRRGFVPHDWNLASADASTTPVPAAQIVRNVVNAAENKPRGVVLMHDSQYKYTTVEALPSMIDRLQEMGFTLDRLDAHTQPILFSYPD